MAHNSPRRRDFLSIAAASAVGFLSTPNGARADSSSRPSDEPFLYGLNTSTIRGQKLTIAQEAELAAKVGFKGIEPWIRELDEYVNNGGSLKDLGKRLQDLGLSVESAIGFFDWVVDDDARRKKGFEEARRNLEMLQKLGGKRLAAPPVGATDQSNIDLRRIADRYRQLLELGGQFGVVPQVEVWGFSKTLGNLADATFVAVAADHPRACVLTDVYHLYKGGSGTQGLRLLSSEAHHVMHLNDYPAQPPRASITDADRVYPGDGVAPLGQIFRDLRSAGFHGMLSIELFNRGYWTQDPETVLRTALDKAREQVRAALKA